MNDKLDTTREREKREENSVFVRPMVVGHSMTPSLSACEIESTLLQLIDLSSEIFQILSERDTHPLIGYSLEKDNNDDVRLGYLCLFGQMGKESPLH